MTPITAAGGMHWLHEERRYASLDTLREGIAADTAAARAWWQRQLEADTLGPR